MRSRVGSGAVTAGRKIGFTNRAIWAKYNVDRPIWGWMYAAGVAQATSAADVLAVDVGAMSQPAVEPEIVVRLARAVRPGETIESLAAALEWVALGFEIVECHYPEWRFETVDVVVDGGLHASMCVGPPVRPWPGMLDDLVSFRLRLYRDDELVDEGRGSNVLDGALHSIVHLLDVVGEDGLAAGEIITTGTVTDAARAFPGQQFRVELDGIRLEPVAIACH